MDQIMIQKGMTAALHIDDQHFLGLAPIPLHKLAQNWAALRMHQVYLIFTQKMICHVVILSLHDHKVVNYLVVIQD
jgi:hypothetical protein